MVKMKVSIRNSIIVLLSTVLSLNSAFATTSAKTTLPTLWQQHKDLIDEKLYLDGVKLQYDYVEKSYDEAIKIKAKLKKIESGKIDSDLVNQYNSQYQTFIQVKASFIDNNQDFYERYPDEKYSATELMKADIDRETTETYISRKVKELLAPKAHASYPNKPKLSLKEKINQSRYELLVADPNLKKVTEAYEKARAIELALQSYDQFAKHLKAQVENSDKHEIKSFITGVFLGLIMIAAVLAVGAIALQATMVVYALASLFGAAALVSNSTDLTSHPIKMVAGAIMTGVASFLVAVVGPFYLGTKIANKHFGIMSRGQIAYLRNQLAYKEQEIQQKVSNFVSYMEENGAVAEQIDSMILSGADGTTIKKKLIIP